MSINLIRYDSIYSYSSTNYNMDTKKMDSLMKQFFQIEELCHLKNHLMILILVSQTCLIKTLETLIPFGDKG